MVTGICINQWCGGQCFKGNKGTGETCKERERECVKCLFHMLDKYLLFNSLHIVDSVVTKN